MATNELATNIERRDCKHGEPCLIYTQTKPSSRNYGTSVYACQRNDRCEYRERVSIPLQTCETHDCPIKVRVFREEDGVPVILFSCTAQKSISEWCGTMYLEPDNPDKENEPPQTAKDIGSDHTHSKSVNESFHDDDSTKEESVINSSTHSVNSTVDGTDEQDSTEESMSAYNVNNAVYIDEQNSMDESTASTHAHSLNSSVNTNENSAVEEESMVDDSAQNSLNSTVDTNENSSIEEESMVDNSTHSLNNTNEEDSIDEEESTAVNSTHSAVDTDEQESSVEEESIDGSTHSVEAVSVSHSLLPSQPSLITGSHGTYEGEETTNVLSSSDSVVKDPPKYRDVPVEIEDTSSDNSGASEASDDDERSGAQLLNHHSSIQSHDPSHNRSHKSHDRSHERSVPHDVSTSVLDTPTESTGSNGVDNHGRTDSQPPFVAEDKKEPDQETQFKVGVQFRKLVKQLADHQLLIAKFGPGLPDGGARLREQENLIKQRMLKLRGYIPSQEEIMEYLNKPIPDEDEGHEVSVKQRFHSNAMHSMSKQLTFGVVQNLHSSLGSCPGEDVLEEGPKELTVELMRHQKRALAWLIWREKEIPHGGILADDMGLGKTLSMISLILKQRDCPRDSSRDSSDQLLRVKGTLVVVPLTLLDMWNSEIKSKVEPHNLSVLIYHGPKRTKDYRDFQYYDVVITTYTIVGGEAGHLVQEMKKKPVRKSACDTLFRVHWNRIILDEAHNIRNSKTATSIGCCGLHGDNKWAMTGTPIQNKLEDFYSLVKFLKLSPFDDLRVWKDTISNRSTVGMQRLRTMVSTLVLRRTKDEMMTEKVINLPSKTVVVHEIELEDIEKKIYDVLFEEGRGFFQRYLTEQGESFHRQEIHTKELLERLPPNVAHAIRRILDSILKADTMIERSSKGRMVLVLLLRLRQACSHLNLLCTAIEADTLIEELDVTLAMSAISLNPDGSSSSRQQQTMLDSSTSANIPLEFNKYRPGSKINEIIKELERIFSLPEDGNKPTKCIIVSQWTSMFNILELHLNKKNISFTRIDGKVPARDRQNYVTLFNSRSSDPRVMLLSLQAGGVGLTLTGANHVFIIDLHWNPQLEQQAADRCHRVGQTKDVFVHRFVVKNTIEVGIQNIQQKKLQLAQDVLSGADRRRRKANFGLTLADLKQLFEVS